MINIKYRSILVLVTICLFFCGCQSTEADNSESETTDCITESNIRTDYTYSTVSETENQVKVDYIKFDGSDCEEANTLIRDYAYRYVYENSDRMDEVDYINVSCEVKYYDNRKISIIFECDLNIHTAPYPNRIIYALTFELKDCKVIRLSEQYNIDDRFVGLIREKLPEQLKNRFGEIDKSAIDWFNSTYDDETLKKALETADSVGDISFSSYLSDDYLGIYIPVLHVFGNYWEVRIEKNLLEVLIN